MAKDNCVIEVIKGIGVLDDRDSGEDEKVEEGVNHSYCNVRVAGVEI